MKRSRRSWRWRVLIGMLTLPFFQGACADLIQRSMINGFFNAVTPLLAEQWREELDNASCDGEQP